MSSKSHHKVILLLFIALPLLVMAQKPELVLPIGHNDRVNSVAFSPDGKYIVTASNDNTAKLWETSTGKLVYTLEGHFAWVTIAVISKNGKFVVTVSDDETAKLWETCTGNLISTLNTGGVALAVLSNDGKCLLTASFDNTAKLWETSTGKLHQTLDGHTGSVRSAAFSNDGKYVVTASDDNTARLWETSTGKLVHTMEGHCGIVLSVVFSYDMKYVLTSSADRTAKLWETATGKLIHTLLGHNGVVYSAIFSNDGMYILTSSNDGTAKLWETYTGYLLSTLNNGIVISAVLSNDGKYILTKSSDKTTKLWEISTGNLICILNAGLSVSAAFSDDGKYVLTANIENTAKLWETSTGKLIHTLEGHSGIVWSVVFSNDMKYALTASFDKTAKLWEISSGKLIHILEGHTGSVRSAVFNNDGKYVLTSSSDNTTKLWETSTGKLIYTLDGFSDKNKFIWFADFSNDGKYILTNSYNANAKLWETATGKLYHTLEGHTLMVRSAIFSNDGNYVVTASDDNTAKLWETSTGKLIHSLEGHREDVWSAAFSPDGQYIVTASADSTARLWETSTGKLIHTMEGHSGIVLSAAFSNDMKNVLTSSADRTAKLWKTAPVKLTNTLEGHTDDIRSEIFSNDGMFVLTASDDNTAKLWETSTGKLIHTLEGHAGSVFSAVFCNDGNYIVTAGADCKMKFWDAQSGKEIASLISVDSTNWIVTTPSGLFDASEGAMKRMYYVKGLEVIELNQLKDRYWEPGLFEKAMSGRALRDVRGMDQLKLQPEIELGEVTEGKLDVTLIKRDGGYGKVTILINGKEILADARGEGFDTTKAVQSLQVNIRDHPYLLAGQENVITVKASSADGFVQSRGTDVIYVPEAQAAVVPPSFYALICGVNQYANPAIQLRYSVHDAESVAQAVELAAHNLFGKERTHVYLMTSPGNKPPTREHIQEAVHEIAAMAKADDILLLYLSGHGITWGGDMGDFYYLTPDAFSSSSEAYSDPVIRSKSAISTAEFVELIKTIPALKQVMIIDACGSGKAVENLLAMREIDPSQIKAIDRMKDRTGMFVLSGCAADAQSYEASAFGQGLLTYTLLQAMKGAALKDNNYVDVTTICEYASVQVPELARGIGGIQKPQLLSGKSGSFDIGILEPHDRDKIQLAVVKPVFVWSNIQDEEAYEDVLGIGEAVDNRLYEISARGPESGIAFFKVKEFSDACKISGRYQQHTDKITFSGKIKCKGNEILLQLSAKDKDELVEMITQEALKVKL